MGSIRQKDNQGTHHCVVSWILRSLSVLPSSSTILRFSICFIYNARGFFVCFAVLSGKEIHLLHLVQNQKPPFLNRF